MQHYRQKATKDRSINFSQGCNFALSRQFCALTEDEMGCSAQSPRSIVPIKASVSRRTPPYIFLSAFAILGAVEAQAHTCPTAKDEIATDRPDVTNSSLVVPTGSLQSENGVNFSARDGGRVLDGTNTRWRLGIAPCLELLLDLPTYFAIVRRPGNSGSRKSFNGSLPLWPHSLPLGGPTQ